MKKKYIIEEKELKDLVIARAILNVLRQASEDYAERNREYLQECIEDFGCKDLDEVADKLVLEFEYTELK